MRFLQPSGFEVNYIKWNVGGGSTEGLLESTIYGKISGYV
jgi:hypothetical protein